MAEPTAEEIGYAILSRDNARLRAQAQNRARQDLVANHRDEYDALYQEHKRRLQAERDSADEVTATIQSLKEGTP